MITKVFCSKNKGKTIWLYNYFCKDEVDGQKVVPGEKVNRINYAQQGLAQ